MIAQFVEIVILVSCFDDFTKCKQDAIKFVLVLLIYLRSFPRISWKFIEKLYNTSDFAIQINHWTDDNICNDASAAEVVHFWSKVFIVFTFIG